MLIRAGAKYMYMYAKVVRSCIFGRATTCIYIVCAQYVATLIVDTLMFMEVLHGCDFARG